MWRAEKMAYSIYRASSSTDTSCPVCLEDKPTRQRCRHCPAILCDTCYTNIMQPGNSNRCPSCRTPFGLFVSNSDRHSANIRVDITSTFKRTEPENLNQFRLYEFSNQKFYMNVNKSVEHEMKIDEKTSMNRDIPFIYDADNTAFDMIIYFAQQYAIHVTETYDANTDSGTFKVTLTKRPDQQLDAEVDTMTVELLGDAVPSNSLYHSYIGDENTKASPTKLNKRKNPVRPRHIPNKTKRSGVNGPLSLIF